MRGVGWIGRRREGLWSGRSMTVHVVLFLFQRIEFVLVNVSFISAELLVKDARQLSSS